MNATFSNNFEHFFDLHYTLKIVYGTIFTLSEILAFCSYSGFVYYEHYAGDPLKRSIKNKLISQCFLLMMGQVKLVYGGVVHACMSHHPSKTPHSLTNSFIHFTQLNSLCETNQ